MSGSFTGFSEDDIRKLSDKKPKDVIAKHTVKPQNRATNTQVSTHSEYKSKILDDKIKQAIIEPIQEGAMLNKPKIEKSNNDNIDNSITIEKVLDTSKQEKKLNLEEFQTRQKLIEEQNRKRKEILINAIAAKTKQTKEEAQRINGVQHELKKIDALLCNDVKFLRKQIEFASWDYMEAQKRYFKIEKEFLEAKVVLHQKLERKELLTEHLCTIIEKNEERKAEKLNELLLKLNLSADLGETKDTPKPSEK